MSLSLLSGPQSEPLSLSDVKNWVKVTDSSDDALLQSLISSARLAVEAATGRLLISQQWRLTLDLWPDVGALDSPLTPVRSIARIRVMDAAGAYKDVSAALFTLDAGDDWARIYWGAPLPSPGVQKGGIQIDLVAGYGDAPDATPAPLRLAMRLLIAFWHANRGDADVSTGQLPMQVTALLAPYRVRRLV